jgi:predicted LPLAT superfamily acyltransferase
VVSQTLLLAITVGKIAVGVMGDLIVRMVSNIIGRVHGPMALRFVLQPVTAMLLAARDGVKDAREHHPPYLHTVLTRPDQRAALLRHGLKAVARIMVIGSAMDAIYQLIVLKWIYPGELINVVLLLAFVPYVLVRGPANRVARRWMARRVRAV